MHALLDMVSGEYDLIQLVVYEAGRDMRFYFFERCISRQESCREGDTLRAVS